MVWFESYLKNSDGSSRARLKMIPENKMKKVIPFGQNRRLVKKTCVMREKTESH